jgi:hypothetical protein
VIRRLGAATGGVVNEGASLQIALLVFIVVFGAWCMLLVPAQTLVRGWREADVYESGLPLKSSPREGDHERVP